MRFINGLRDDVKAVVIVQHPVDLDSVVVVAQLQEEVSEPLWLSTSRKVEFYTGVRASSRNSYPLPPPPKIDRPFLSSPTGDKTIPKAMHSGSSEERWATLKIYRHAHGLYDKCAEKWVCGQRCRTTVQLQVLEEMLDLF